MPTVRSTALLSALVLSACAGELRSDPSPPRVRALARAPEPRSPAARGVVVAEDDRCVACHQAIGAEWRGSLHRRSWTDPVFLAAFSVEPLPFCRGCHAPEGPRSEGAAAHPGVGCVTCHSMGDHGLADAGRSTAPVSSASGSAAPASTSECASCHEFDFPDPQEALMQSTASEHARSSQREEPCDACHMPVVDGHKSHAFTVIGDPDRLRSAVEATARITGERNLEITLRAPKAGHDVPTGDMFRRLVVRAVAQGDNRARPEVLARSFRREIGAHGSRRVQTGDTRLSGDGAAATVSLFFLRPIALPLRWEVVYQRMDEQEAALFGVDLSADETVLTSGVLPRRDP